MPIKFLLLGGGFWVSLGGGVEVPILFLWAWGFFRNFTLCHHAHPFVVSPPLIFREGARAPLTAMMSVICNVASPGQQRSGVAFLRLEAPLQQQKAMVMAGSSRSIIDWAKDYAASGLPQGPFWKTISTSLKLGKKKGFCQYSHMSSKWVKSGF